MEDWAVSPRYKASELKSGKANAVDVFEDQVKGWVLAFAKRLTAEEHSGIAVTMLVLLISSGLSLSEEVRTAREGAKSSSRARFNDSFRLSRLRAESSTLRIFFTMTFAAAFTTKE